jgi:hypothetical protein
VLHVLAVDSGGGRELDAPPSFEILRAHSAEDAVEKLSRNRRIDAVLFFDDETARATALLLSEEGGVAPPLFREGPSGVTGVAGLDSGSLFEDLRRLLGG